MACARSVLVATILAGGCAGAPRPPPAAPSAVSLPRSSSLAPDQQPGFAVPVGAQLSERNRCVDRELVERQLNDFGDPEGTTYPGGSPLLGVTGRAGDRHEYVLRHHPEIGVTCTQALGEPER
ncbi:MAG TPA: hypothetical protein VEM76_15165 [Anaeromyxobacteraceae bacterium]|nr:hypothetical protein [Anaeromyxobacteraceae bacterium]